MLCRDHEIMYLVISTLHFLFSLFSMSLMSHYINQYWPASLISGYSTGLIVKTSCQRHSICSFLQDRHCSSQKQLVMCFVVNSSALLSNTLSMLNQYAVYSDCFIIYILFFCFSCGFIPLLKMHLFINPAWPDCRMTFRTQVWLSQENFTDTPLTGELARLNIT